MMISEFSSRWSQFSLIDWIAAVACNRGGGATGPLKIRAINRQDAKEVRRAERNQDDSLGFSLTLVG
jgi:hypothetical protein